MTGSAKSPCDHFAAEVFASSPFLVDLAEFIRCREGGNVSHLFSSKPLTLPCLSSEVSARLQMFSQASATKNKRHSKSKYGGKTQGHRQQTRTHESTVDYAYPVRPNSENVTVVTTTEIGSGGIFTRIDWSRVHIPSSEDGEDLAEGVRLAISCHAALNRHRSFGCSTVSTADEGVPQVGDEPQDASQVASTRITGLINGIVNGSAEDVYVCLCICLTMLEKTLFSIAHEKAPPPSQLNAKVNEVYRQRGDGGKAPIIDFDVDNSDAGGNVAEIAAAPAMILRDLIATPQVKAALPEQLLVVLRLLLLPMGFNIRNLVWHGFLAPTELPRELASFVLVVTLDVIRDAPIAEEMMTQPHYVPPFVTPGSWDECHHSTAGGGERDRSEAQRVQVSGRDNITSPPIPPFLLQEARGRCAGWALDSFDGQLKCPPTLRSAMGALLCDCARQRRELDDLLRRSAFVLPGREGIALYALDALREGRDVLCLVALLPVLEHGLRCLFSCANGSPGHLFAQLRRYYSTLDGFGQRARHQLLLDQDLAGCPNESNLLLPVLGSGLSACLLDIFMMDAGPGLRGKVAHAEVDMSNVFSSHLTASFPEDVGSRSDGHADLVLVTVAAFLVLCRRYDPGVVLMVEDCSPSQPKSYSGSNTRGHDKYCTKSRLSPLLGVTQQLEPSVLGFEEALSTCEDHLGAWVPRFHPHELLENDMQACQSEFEHLARILDTRVVSIERLPADNDGHEGSSALARMTVIVNTGCSTAAYGYEALQRRVCREHEKGMRMSSDKTEQSRAEDEKSVREEQRSLTLTVTDTAHRLVPPMGVGSGAIGAGKKAEGKGGVLSIARRVRTALCAHSARIAGRFTRIVEATAAGVENGGNEHDGSSKYRADESSPTTPSQATVQLSCNEQARKQLSPPLVFSEVKAVSSSAFAPYMHSERCLDDTSVCQLDCLNPACKSTACGNAGGSIDHSFGKEASRIRFPSESERRKVNTNIESPAQLMVGRQQLQHQYRVLKRISPPTNVINVCSLPQIGCLTGLCRASADILRGLATRVLELENQVTSGTARSGQRRAYASTLMVAPTLLCFLSQTMATVEAFVREWDAYHSSLVVVTNDKESRPGYDPVDGHIPLDEDDLWQNTLLKGFDIVPSQRAYTEEEGNNADAIGNQPRSGGSGKSIRDQQQNKKPSGGSSSMMVDQLAFLRRLAAVTGSLGLCVSIPGGSTKMTRESTGNNVVRNEDGISSSSTASAVGGVGRKGYVQALTELAVFLETRVAERGFGGSLTVQDL